MAWVSLAQEEMLDLDRALDELELIDAGKVRAVELRYFLGCTAEEAGDILRRSKASVDRDLQIARAWLSGALAAMDPGNASSQYQLTTVFRNRGMIHNYNHDPRAAIQDFLTAAEMHRQLTAKDPANKIYRYLRGELLARTGNLLQAIGKPVEARATIAEALSILVSLASDQNPSLPHVLGACGWLTETEVLPLRDPASASRLSP